MKMPSTLLRIHRARVKLAASFAICLGFIATSTFAKPVPENLGYGLDKLVESNLILQEAASSSGKGAQDNAVMLGAYNGYATQEAADYAASAITEEESGRVMVDIVLGGRVGFNDVQDALANQIGSLTITATDATYRSTGVIEGWVSVDDVPALAKVAGVRSVFLALKPELDSVILTSDEVLSRITNSVPTIRRIGALNKTLPPAPGGLSVAGVLNKIGTAFDQGVTQHRVDKIDQLYNPSAPFNYTGNGISIAAISDSFDTRAAAPHAATGVANFDLPGSPSNPINPQPVVVFVDDTPATGSDEGRAMTEIIHKMAPKARLAFASGVYGEVAFGNSVRQMAGIPTVAPSGFKADVICDDLSYGGEPFFTQSIIGNAIDDVAAAGVSYFSSAGNNIGINAYESPLRMVPNGSGLTAAGGNAALANTNIDLTGVPTNLYAGGFHNFNPSGQLDVAQLVNMPTNGQSSEMQWDDPYDLRDLTLDQPPIYSNSGNSTAGSTVTFSNIPPLIGGKSYVIQETATSGNFDGIVSVFDSSNNLIISQDTGTDETITFFPPVSGTYTIQVAPFVSGGVPTFGNFNLTINTANGTVGVTTDLNLLVFRDDTGAFIASRSLTSNNLANNRPVELGNIASPSGRTQIQFVIARANNPTASQLPTRVRWSVRGNGAGGIGPAEYFTYNAVTTKGHATARGCNGTAAYSVFRPNQAETFTSPGPATILFDKNSNRLAIPEIRLCPTVAAADGGNTSFFSSDSASDPDTNQNFFGTSAAAPHAAAVAGLVLQSKGGPGSVTPTQMTSILQRSAFPHDLDPSFASASVKTSVGGKVVITIGTDNDSNTSTGLNDPNSIAVSYVGAGSLASLTFNPAGTASTGGHVTGGNNGVQDNAASSPATVTYFANNYPGLVFLPATKAFTLGTLTGLTTADIVQPLSVPSYTGFSNLAPLPANGTTQFWTMTIGFPTGNFTGGKVMRFTVGRGAQHSSNLSGTVPGTGPTGGTVTLNPIADLFGNGVFIPDGNVVPAGMAFSGTTTGGATFSGTIQNRIGAGYTPVDAYGMINAEKAVQLPIQ